MIIITLTATVFLHLLFPVIFVLAKGKTTKKKAKIIALINSAACAMVLFLFSLIVNIAIPYSESMFAPALFYYLINRRILTDKKPTDGDAPTNKPDNETQNQYGENADDDNNKNF